jgi:restriction system protein
VLVLVLAWILIDLYPPFAIGWVALSLLIVFGVIPWWRREVLFNRADAVVSEHIAALVRQRTILVRTDAYGKPLLGKWNSEINYFITNHVRPALDADQRFLLERHRQSVAARIAQCVESAVQQRPALSTVSANMTGAEFEVFCADHLRACGWHVQVTPASMDQGVDVIAEKNGLRVAIQCKLYANPVGNKAVQEIAAGRVHQQAHFGAVVTNGTFTRSAKQLAATNGIRLLHCTDLPQLECMLSQPVSHGSR